MDPFEHNLRDELHRAAASGPAMLTLDRVYARARRLQREQTARVTLASVGAVAAVGWGAYAAAGHAVGFDRLRPVVVPPPAGSASGTPSPSASPDEPSATPSESAAPAEPSTTATADPTEEPIPETGPPVPFDPPVDVPANGPAAAVLALSQEPDSHGDAVVTAKAYDPDGWVREIDFEYPDDPSVETKQWTFPCDPDAPEPLGGDVTGWNAVHFLAPGDHDVVVTVTSGSCDDDPISDQQWTTERIVVTASATVPPRPRKDLS